MGRATVIVSSALVMEAFPFPDGTRIAVATLNNRGDLVLVLEHADLPEVREGDEPTLISPLFRRATFEDWGVSK